MEFDEIIVKESPGLCRCCLSEGCYKDLGTEYTWMNDTEVYADMLLECFDIGISQHNEGPNGPNRLICEVCITRLRDACNFKKQVLESEKRFVDMVGRGDFAPKVVVYPAMKPEVVSEEVLAEDAEVEYLEEDLMDYDDKLPMPESPTPETSDDMSLATLKVKNKRGRPRKTATVEKPEKKTKIAKTEDKPRTSKGLKSGNEFEDEEDSVPLKRNLECLRENVLQVLMNSTVMPFKWLDSCYRCFFCYNVYLQPEDLKDHTRTHTYDAEIFDAMQKYCKPIVFIDVSEIACKLCPDEIRDYDHLIEHLILKHNVRLYLDISNVINPFKLNNTDISCTECSAKFDNFGSIILHARREHGKCNLQFLCEMCEVYFETKHELLVHITCEHANNSFKCPQCGVRNPDMKRLRAHLERFHGKCYKCIICEEGFETSDERLQHMLTIHKNRNSIVCPYCFREYKRRLGMLLHVRDMHLHKEKNTCPVCGYTCMEKLMAEHLMKHERRPSNEDIEDILLYK